MVKISRFASTPTAWSKLRTHAPLGGSGTIQQPGASTGRLRSHYGPTNEGDRYLASLLCKIAAAWLFAMVLVLARNVTAAASSCISITSPSAGATVSSSSVAIATTDTCSGLWYENLYVDGTYTNSFAPGTVVLDSTIFSSGSHTIEVTSQSENPGSVTLGRASESLKINNSCISITSPSAGATASGSSVAIATTDTCSGLWYENLYVDGTYIKSFAPGTVVLDSTIFSSGSHTIEVTSQSENPGSVTLGSTSESLNIQNGVATRTPSPSPKPSPTSTAKPSPSPTPKPTPTVQNGTSSSPSAEPKPTSTPTPKPSSTPKPSPTPTPKPSSTATPKPTSTATPVPVSHLSNLPPGAVLPSESTCATLANQANFPETTLENVNDGTGWDANNQIWTTPSYFYANAGRDGLAPAADFTAVDGKYSGTTQDIIRWSACKWGVDEDWAYAETAEETGSWTNACAQMHGGSTCHEAGDCGNYDSDSGGETANLSFLGFAVTDSSAQFIGPNAYTGQSSDGSTCSSVWSSWSIIQSKARYFEWYTWPMLAISTAWGEDYRWAKYRACVNGDYATWFGDASDYLNAVSRALSNPNGLVPSGQAGPTNLFTNETNMQYVGLGCIATHYSGGWYDSGAVSYLTDSSSGFLYHLNGSVWPGGLR